MNRFEAGRITAENEAIRSLDTKMFTTRDVVNVALQRNEVLQDIRGHSEAINAWVRGDEAPMRHIADTHRDDILARALAFVFMEYHALRPRLQSLAPERIADIGAGYGFFALFAHAEFGAEVTLIDTDSTMDRALDQGETTMSVTNLAVARQFLLANGCLPERIRMMPAGSEGVEMLRDLDLVVSFLACGYQFPCDDYLDFFETNLKPGGTVLLDIRTSNAHEILPGLANLGALTRVSHAADGKAIRMALVTRRRNAEQAA